MYLIKIFLLLAVIACTACTMDRSYAKPQASFVQYKKIAVIRFDNPKDVMAGQEAADIVALEFVNHGFTVVSGSQVASLIDQNELYSAGLTQDIKARLKQAGIEAIVLGTLNEYYCTNNGAAPTIWNLARKNVCNVSLTLQLLDINSGEILWGTTASGAQGNESATVKKALLSVAKQIEPSIPDAQRKTAMQK